MASPVSPDQLWNLVAHFVGLTALRRADLWIEASSPILSFFIIRGVAPT